MPRDQKYWKELVDKISKTPGFEIQGVNGDSGVRCVNLATGIPYVIHKTSSDSRTQKNRISDLAKWGWTEGMYAESQEAERKARIEAHNAKYPAIPEAAFMEPYSHAEQPAFNGAKEEGEGVLNEVTSDEFAEFLGMRPTIEYITQEKAQEYFNQRLDSTSASAFGFRNRHFAMSTVIEYAKAMVRGEWLPNPAGIMFSTDDDGKEWVIDGQQRMAAVIYANEMYKAEHNGEALKPIAFWVYRDVPSEMFKVLDGQRKRTNSQMLQMMGVGNYTVVSSALRYVNLWFTEPDQKKWKRAAPLTNTQLEELFKEHKDVAVDSYRIGNAGSVCGLSKSAMVAACYIIAHYAPHVKNPQPANDESGGFKLSLLDQFLEDFRNGANMGNGDPVHTLREYAIRRLRADIPRQDPVDKMGVSQVMFHMMLIIRAWNSRVRGKTINSIAWRRGQEIPMPLIPYNPED